MSSLLCITGNFLLWNMNSEVLQLSQSWSLQGISSFFSHLVPGIKSVTHIIERISWIQDKGTSENKRNILQSVNLHLLKCLTTYCLLYYILWWNLALDSLVIFCFFIYQIWSASNLCIAKQMNICCKLHYYTSIYAMIENGANQGNNYSFTDRVLPPGCTAHVHDVTLLP